MLDVITLQGSAVRWWYMEYGVVGGAYGHAVVPVGADVADSGVVIAPGNMELAPVDMDAATDVAAALKQLTGLW